MSVSFIDCPVDRAQTVEDIKYIFYILTYFELSRARTSVVGLDLDGEGLDLDGEWLDLDAEGLNLDGEGLISDGERLDLDGEGLDLDGKGQRVT